MSFFKRLKEKLIGGNDEPEQKVDQPALGEQETTDQPAVAFIEETTVQEPVEQAEPVVEVEVVKVEAPPEKAEAEQVEAILFGNEVIESAEVVGEPVEEKKPSAWSITQKFKAGLEKTRNSFTSKVNDLVARYRKVDEDFFEELEELLLQADVGFETVMELMDKLRVEVQRQNIKDTNGIQAIISEKLVEIYESGEDNLTDLNIQQQGDLTVILFVGVNGVGKTTTIGKLAHRLKSEGKTVMLAAGDTFRAGAIEP